MKHLIKIESVAHGVVSVKHKGNDSQYCEAGEVVKIKWQPTAGWGLQEVHYTPESGDPVAIEDGEFIMPSANITIGATFKKFVIGDWTSGQDSVNNEGKFLGFDQSGNIVPIDVLSQTQEMINNSIDESVPYVLLIDVNGLSEDDIIPTSKIKRGNVADFIDAVDAEEPTLCILYYSGYIYYAGVIFHSHGTDSMLIISQNNGLRNGTTIEIRINTQNLIEELNFTEV